MSPTDPEDTARIIANLLVRVYEIHEHILTSTGGIEGLRDAASLHAAVARPFATFGSEDLYADDFEKAAALFHSLIKSHPFMDGTKRTALAATLYFLESYGHPRPGPLPEDEVIHFCITIAEENSRRAEDGTDQPITISEIAAWLRRLLTP